MVIHFVWKEKRPGVQLFTDSCTEAKGLAEGLGKGMTGKLVRKTSGEEA